MHDASDEELNAWYAGDSTPDICEQCNWNYPITADCDLCGKAVCDICESRHMDECEAFE